MLLYLPIIGHTEDDNGLYSCIETRDIVILDYLFLAAQKKASCWYLNGKRDVQRKKPQLKQCKEQIFIQNYYVIIAIIEY